jgi:hypothetical protein
MLFTSDVGIGVRRSAFVDSCLELRTFQMFKRQFPYLLSLTLHFPNKQLQISVSVASRFPNLRAIALSTPHSIKLDFSVFKVCKKLEKIFLYWFSIRKKDMSHFSGLPNLTVFVVQQCQFDLLNLLYSLPVGLRELHCLGHGLSPWGSNAAKALLRFPDLEVFPWGFFDITPRLVTVVVCFRCDYSHLPPLTLL